MGEGNGFVPLVPLEDLPADLRAQWEVTPRAGLQDFLRLMANAPDFFRGFSDLNGKIRANNHKAEQVALLHDLCDTMVHGSLCAMGSMTPIPVTSALKHFPQDFGLAAPDRA